MNRSMLKVAAAALLVTGSQVALAYAEPGDTETPTAQDKEKERLEQQTKLY
jgi:hypothetical protein